MSIKEQIKSEYMNRYLLNKSMLEKDIYLEDPKFFEQALTTFETWSRLESEVGIKQRHIKERTKFFLFLTMKDRLERFGKASLLHKNIEENLKEAISENYGSVKTLTKEILSDERNKERVIYDAHTFFLSGGTPNSLSAKNLELLGRIQKHFTSTNDFYNEYENRFLIQPLNEPGELIAVETETTVYEEVAATTAPAAVADNGLHSFNVELLEALVNVNYLEQGDAEEILKLAQEPDEVIAEYITDLDLTKPMDELREENKALIQFVEIKYSSLEEARKKLIS